MCGVVAIFSSEGAVSKEALERATASLDHRGPDGRQTWISSERRIGLGHTRLSIIDLETGSQPIANEDERIRIVVNGEFYDYQREQRALERAGHRLRSRSDSEIALHLYEDLGVDAVHRLRGEFAFVIWDENRERLVAVRDRYGIKPLYYSLHKGALYLASEMKALFAAGVPARWDLESAYLGQALRGPGRTPFEGVHALPAGHYLSADRNGVEITQYWDVDYPLADEPRPARSDEDLVRDFRAAFEEAVALRLRADVPVACYLSGGLDSCAILGMAARLRSDPVTAFTLRFEGDGYDEGEIAQEMAALAGADYVPLAVGQDDLADNFADAVFHAEGACANAHGVAKFMLSRKVRDDGYKVVLTGEGADEVLAGYPHFRQDMLLQGDGKRGDEETAELLKQLEQANRVSRGMLLAEGGDDASLLKQRDQGFMPAWLKPQLARFDHLRVCYADDYLAAFEARDLREMVRAGLNLKPRVKNLSPVNQSLYLWAKTMLPNFILATLGDRMEMAHSVEGRLPFLDHKLGEFLQTTPLDLKIRGMTEKYLLREATRDVITERVYRRHKHPFLSPPATIGPSRKFRDLLRDTLHSDAVKAIPFFDAAKVRRFAGRLDSATPGQRPSVDRQVMLVASTIVLHQRMGVAG